MQVGGGSTESEEKRSVKKCPELGSSPQRSDPGAPYTMLPLPSLDPDSSQVTQRNLSQWVSLYSRRDPGTHSPLKRTARIYCSSVCPSVGSIAGHRPVCPGQRAWCMLCRAWAMAYTASITNCTFPSCSYAESRPMRSSPALGMPRGSVPGPQVPSLASHHLPCLPRHLTTLGSSHLCICGWSHLTGHLSWSVCS